MVHTWYTFIMSMKRIQKIALIFVLAFALNIAWENLHAPLYVHYRGAPITELILLRSALVDALLIAIICAPFLWVATLKKRSWLIVPIGIVLAIYLELWALDSGRWAYNSLMPILPFLGVGLTPTIQLGLLGWISYKTADAL